MPNSNTFDVEPIRQLITKYARGVIVDPFANQNKIATITNDLNPAYDTTYHMDATDFLKMLDDASADTMLYDPPYSPRQVAECYKEFGQTANVNLLIIALMRKQIAQNHRGCHNQTIKEG